MPDINIILSSSGQYKQAFEEGLTRVLQHNTAGTFILACANLFQHPTFLTNNSPLLHEAYHHIKEHYLACQQEGRQPDDAADDIAVMNGLIAIGLENLEAVEYRKMSSDGVDYLLNYNQLRSFRPARLSKIDNAQLNSPFNSGGFHFDKAFLQKEIFAEGEADGRQVSLLYNKFPFIDYHTLLVVDKEKHLSQLLTLDVLDYIFKLQTRTQQHCSEFVITYNSLGAGASVNHCHFHTYLETTPLAIFNPQFEHNGGDLPYPATCHAFTHASAAWQTIDALHNNNKPYNLLIKDHKIFCLPRKASPKGSEVELSSGLDTTQYGWSQMAGLINVDNRKLLSKLSVTQILSSLKLVSAQVK